MKRFRGRRKGRKDLSSQRDNGVRMRGLHHGQSRGMKSALFHSRFTLVGLVGPVLFACATAEDPPRGGLIGTSGAAGIAGAAGESGAQTGNGGADYGTGGDAFGNGGSSSNGGGPGVGGNITSSGGSINTGGYVSNGGNAGTGGIKTRSRGTAGTGGAGVFRGCPPPRRTG